MRRADSCPRAVAEGAAMGASRVAAPSATHLSRPPDGKAIPTIGSSNPIRGGN